MPSPRGRSRLSVRKTEYRPVGLEYHEPESQEMLKRQVEARPRTAWEGISVVNGSFWWVLTKMAISFSLSFLKRPSCCYVN